MFFGLIHLIRLSGLELNAWLTKCCSWSSRFQLLRRQVSWILSGFNSSIMITHSYTINLFFAYIPFCLIFDWQCPNKSIESHPLSSRIDMLNLQTSILVSRCFRTCYVGRTRQRVVHLVLMIHLNYKHRNQIRDYMNSPYINISRPLLSYFSSVLSVLRIGYWSTTFSCFHCLFNFPLVCFTSTLSPACSTT